MAKLDSAGIDATIKRLEEDGRRLGTVVQSSDLKIDTPPGEREKPQVMLQLQKLRKEIESQNQETLNLEKNMQDAAKIQSFNHVSFLNRNTNKSNNFVTPNSFLYSNTPGPYGDLRPSTPQFNINSNVNSNKALEQAFEDSQIQVDYLKRKLENVHEMCEKQKEQFRSSVEELQLKLQETVRGRKRLMDMREAEMVQQEDMICRLQSTVKELAASNQMQEQVLSDIHKQMDMLQKKDKVHSTAMEQIRTILNAQDRLKGKTSRLFDSQRLSEVSPELLVDSLERFVIEMQEDNDELRNKVLQMEAKLRSNEETYKVQTNLMVSEHNQQLNEIRMEANSKLEDHRRINEDKNYQIKCLKERSDKLEAENQDKAAELKNTKDELNMVLKQFEDLKSHYLAEKDQLGAEIQSLSTDHEELQKKYALVKCDYDNLKNRLGEAQTNFLRTNEELKSEQNKSKELQHRENEASSSVAGLRQQLDERNAEVSRLREMNSELRAESAAKLTSQIRQTEAMERSKADEKISKLNAELSQVRQELSRVQGSLEATEKQIADVAMERTKIHSDLADKEREIEQLKSQTHLMELKLAEVNDIRQTSESKLFALRDENKNFTEERNKMAAELSMMKKQMDEKSQSLDHYRRRSESLTADARKYAYEVENTKRLNKDLAEDVKTSHAELESVQKMLAIKDTKIHDYEARISELLQEKCTQDKKRQSCEIDVEQYGEKNKKLTKEIKQANKQIAILIDEKDSLKNKLTNEDLNKQKEISRLKKKLKHAQNSLQQAETSLQAIKSVDGRSAKVAENMQNELTDKRSVIDSFKTELSKAYDSSDKYKKEVTNLKEEVTRLNEQVNQLTKIKQELNEKYKKLTKTEKGYKLAIDRLQKGLENAASRNINAQAVIQEQEQVIAQSKITNNFAPANRIQVEKTEPNLFSNLSNMPTIGGATAQSILGKLILNMNSQTKQDSPLLPTVPINKQQSVQTKESTESASTQEIYKILSEVKDHLLRQYDKENKSGRKIPMQSSEKKGSCEDENNTLNLPVVTLDSDTASFCSLSILREQTTFAPMENTQSIVDVTPLMTSSPLKPANGNATSPVSKLLRVKTSPMIKSPQKALERKKDIENELSAFEKETNTSELLAMSPHNVVIAISDTAEDLCKQLQSRLDGLSKLGGKLQKQNKATDHMIKRQEKNLKKVRENASKLR